MNPITVYTKLACAQCRATSRALQKAHLPCTTVDLTTDRDARDYVMSLGYLQAPVVVAGQRHCSGFRPEAIAALAHGAA